MKKSAMILLFVLFVVNKNSLFSHTKIIQSITNSEV